MDNDLQIRDRIIHALYFRLKSELETREAIAEAARAGADPEVIEAMATDPSPPTFDEIGSTELAENLVDRLRRPEARFSGIM